MPSESACEADMTAQTIMAGHLHVANADALVDLTAQFSLSNSLSVSLLAVMFDAPFVCSLLD